MRRLFFSKRLLRVCCFMLVAVLTLSCLPAGVVQAETINDVSDACMGIVSSGDSNNAIATISTESISENPISGALSDSTYTWNFSDATGETGGSTYDYSDDTVTIRVAVAEGDVLSSAGIEWNAPSCKEVSDSGFESAAATNRYILVKAVADGKINFTANFSAASSSKKARFYYYNLGNVEVDSVDLTTLTKTNGTTTGDITSAVDTNLSVPVVAGNVYALYCYTYSASKITISGLSYTITASGTGEETTESTGAYTWQLKETAAAADGSNYDYADKYAAIRVGLAEEEIISSAGIVFAGASVGDDGGSVADTNRYIMFKPAYAGKISFDVTVADSEKTRVYYYDCGTVDFADADISALVKADSCGRVQLGADITSTAAATRELEVEAGHVYVFYTYKWKAAQITFSNFEYTISATEEDSSEITVPNGVQGIMGGAIVGAYEEELYTWNFSDVAGMEGNNTIGYSDKYAAMKVALGGATDMITASGVVWDEPGCKEADTSGYENIDITNRYILIKPTYSGTIDFSAVFSAASGNEKGRIYFYDFGKAEMDTVDVSVATKNAGTKVGEFTDGNVQDLSLAVEAGRIYAVYSYTFSDSDITLSDFSYTFTATEENTEYVEQEYVNSGTIVKTYDFESGAEEWTLSGAELSTGDKYGGSQSLLLKNGTATTTLTGLNQGSYTVTVWTKGSASSAKLTLSATGGPDSIVKMDGGVGTDEWQQVAHTNVLVYNGQMELNLANYSSTGMYVDKIEVTLDSNDNNPVSNWGFENGLEGWSQEGTVEVITDGVDTGSKAVRLGDQSEVSQTIAVEPDSDYIATVRLKVDEQDTYQSTMQYSLDGTTKMGIFVERETLGNRVNLGVRGLDGVVLRQAPASTEGYALVTIAFHTEANQTQVELYANTKYDQNYVDSVTVYENVDEGNPYPNGWQRPNPNELNDTHAADDWTSNGSDYAYVDNFDVFQVDNTYVKGADMSFQQVIEDCGGKYFANGVQQDALRILSNHGVNSLLQMIFVHSGNEVYQWSDLEHLTTSLKGFDGEYVTGRQQVHDYFDKDHTIAMALRAQELGMTFTPSFHYSDTWISAAKAHMPYEWIEQDGDGNLSNPDIYMLETATYNYVYDFLSDMKDAGVNNVIMIKNGNEQNGGLLFPVATGLGSTHAAIITASSKAARQVYPGAINIIHSNTGYDTAQYSSFYKQLLNSGAEYEGMGFSLYAGRGITSQHKMMLAALDDDTLKYFDYINVETAVSFTKNDPLGNGDGITNADYDVTPAGQYNYLLNFIQAPMNIPNPYGVMRGFYFWNTEAIAVYGAGHKMGEPTGGGVRTMFNNGTESIVEMGSAEPGKMGDMMDSMYAYLHRGNAKAVSADIYTAINSTVNTYGVADATSISIDNRSLSMKVGERVRLQHTIAPVNMLLKDYGVSYSTSDASVATVSEYGFVTAIAHGTATITATIGDVSDTAMVTVGAANAASGMTVTYELLRDGEVVETGTVTEGGTISAMPYDKLKLTTTLSGSPTGDEVVYTMDNTAFAKWYGDTWQTADDTMRTITTPLSTGKYTPIVQLNALTDGVVNVTAKSANNGAALNFAVNIETVYVEAVQINEGDCSVRAENTLQLSATISPANVTNSKVVWSSGDEAIATVNSAGLVTGIAAGTTTITVTAAENPEIQDTITLTVKPVLVEKLLISADSFTMLKGANKALTVTAIPANAANKAVVWSVESGEDVVAISENGLLSGLKAGVAIVVATAEDGSGVTAKCTVTVQEEAVAATGMILSQNEVWMKSNYFAPTQEGKGKLEPIEKLEAVFAPANATDTNVTWSSDDETVASVDENGVVTGHKSGVAHITATSKEGGFTATATVYVPFISEDWENYDLGTSGGGIGGNTFNYTVVSNEDGKALQAKTNGTNGSKTSVNYYTFDAVSGEKVVAEFDWNVGAFVTNKNRGGHLTVADADGNSWLTLGVFKPVDDAGQEMAYYYTDTYGTAIPFGTGDYNYIHGGQGGSYSDCISLGSELLTTDNAEFTVRVELDFITETISFTVTDKADTDISVSVADIPMCADVDYASNIGAIAFSHYFNESGSSAYWTTAIDNLGVYSTSVPAEGLEVSVDCVNMNSVTGIKLVPVTGAVSATAKINATVLPAAAEQKVVYTVTGDAADYIEIAEDGTISIKASKAVSYENQASFNTVTGTIRVGATNSVGIYEDINFSVGAANTNEKLYIYADGEEYVDAVLNRQVGESVKLTYAASGGDGTSDVYSYKWEVVSGDAVIENNVLTAASEGTVEVKFTIDMFKGEVTRTMKLSFAKVDKTELLNLIEEAKSYVTQTQVYTAESLTSLGGAIVDAQAVIEAVDAKQSTINQAIADLQAAMDGLVVLDKEEILPPAPVEPTVSTPTPAPEEPTVPTPTPEPEEPTVPGSTPAPEESIVPDSTPEPEADKEIGEETEEEPEKDTNEKGTNEKVSVISNLVAKIVTGEAEMEEQLESIMGKTPVVPEKENGKGDKTKVEISALGEEHLSKEIKQATDCKNVEELEEYLRKQMASEGILEDATKIIDITVLVPGADGESWIPATAENFPEAGVDIVIPYPEGVDKEKHDFLVGHLITKEVNGSSIGKMEYHNPVKTEEGLSLHINSASPFIVGWKAIEEEVIVSADSAADVETGNTEITESNTSGFLPGLIGIGVLALSAIAYILYKKKETE